MKIRTSIPDSEIERAFEGSAIDFFGYRDLMERLTQMYCKIDGGSVSIIDGKWGSGKSTFAKAWRSYLSINNIPSVYFDAFQHDYNISPFDAIASVFIREAKELRKESEKPYKTFLNAAAKVGRTLAASTVKIGVKAATLGLIGSSEIEDISDIRASFSDEMSDEAELFAKDVLERVSESSDRFSALKESLNALPALLTPKPNLEGARQPMIVIIDELDRCRPDFSLGVLEILKHFFESDRIHFVLITRMSYLRNSINHLYGAHSYSDEYLEKFYDFTINFGSNDSDNYNRRLESFSSWLCDELLVGGGSDAIDLKEFITSMVVPFDLSLRQIEYIVRNAAIIYSSKGEKESFDNLLIPILIVIKLKNPDMYNDARMSKLTYLQIQQFFSSSRWKDNQRHAHILSIFEYHLAPDIDMNDQKWRGYQNYRIDRLKLIAYVCNSMMERFSVRV